MVRQGTGAKEVAPGEDFAVLYRRNIFGGVVRGEASTTERTDPTLLATASDTSPPFTAGHDRERFPQTAEASDDWNDSERRWHLPNVVCIETFTG